MSEIHTAPLGDSGLFQGKTGMTSDWSMPGAYRPAAPNMARHGCGGWSVVIPRRQIGPGETHDDFVQLADVPNHVSANHRCEGDRGGWFARLNGAERWNASQTCAMSIWRPLCCALR